MKYFSLDLTKLELIERWHLFILTYGVYSQSSLCYKITFEIANLEM